MNPVIVPHALNGVTTAIVLFIFACVAWPALVKNRTQFYAAFVSVLVIILLFSLALMLKDSAGFQVMVGFLVGLLQIFAIVMLFLSAGGLTFKEMTGEMARAYEVIRRGEETKTVIIPLTGAVPKPKEEARGATAEEILEQERKLDLAEQAAAKPPVTEKGSIPLE
jgi:hypothetical protein